MSRDGEKQTSPHPEDDPTNTPASPKLDAGGSKPSNCKSSSLNFFGPSYALKERKQVARQRLRDLAKQMRMLQLEEDLNSENSDCEDMEIKPKRKAVYQLTPIKPEKFPSKDFNRWEL